MWRDVLVLVTALSAGVDSTVLQEARIPQILQQFDIRTLLDDGRALNDTQCGQDLNNYFTGITELQGWALTMLDSNAKIPDGLLIGNTFFMGQYDECLSVSNTSYDFKGQHCLPSISITFGGSESGKSVSVRPLMGLEEEVTLVYHYGLCVPSSCCGSQLETILNRTLSLVGLKVSLPDEYCRTAGDLQLSTGDWVVIGFLAVIILIMVLGTFYDVHLRINHPTNKPHPILSSFSAYTNLKSLLAITPNGQMSCLHGLRTFSMMWVILGHAYLMQLFAPNINSLDSLTFMSDIVRTPVTNGFFSVDSFFFLSGLLVCFVFFRDIGRKGGYDVPMSYIHRYLRLTPPYAAMILLQVTIVNVMGDGPLFSQTMTPTTDMCKKSWWAGLLYVQNFVDPFSECLGQSWYLSADMQMYWVAPLLLYPLYLWPKFGPALLVLVTLAMTCLNFAIAYVFDLGPSTLITNNANQDAIDYGIFYMRMAPWVVGVALGYLICGLKAKGIQVKLSTPVVVLGWLLSTALALSVLYPIHVFWVNGWTTLEGASYLAFTRLAWGLVLAWIVFACLNGYGGPVNIFLSWSVFQPLGKLSYCAFLTHMTLITYRVSILRVNTHVTDFPLVYGFIGDWILANLISIPFTLMFEMPFANIERHIFRNTCIFPYPRKPKGKTNKREDEETAKTERTLDEEIPKVEGRVDEEIAVDRGRPNSGFVKEEQ